VRARIQEIGEHRGRWQDLLEIVKHQEMVVVAQRGPEIVQHRPAIWPHAERGGNGGQDEGGLLHVREIHELGGVGSRGDGADGGPGLADAARPGQSDEPHIITAQERLDQPDLAFSAHKRRSRYRQSTGFNVALERQREDTGKFFRQ
jgi:hypothetical protein